MIYMPAERQGKTWKLARPFHGPYRVLHVTDTNIEARLVDRPQDLSIFVHLDRVRKCHPQLADKVWTGPRVKRRRKRRERDSPPAQNPAYRGPTTRSRAQENKQQRSND